MAEKMFCHNCGQELDEAAIYCEQCGVKVGKEDATQFFSESLGIALLLAGILLFTRIQYVMWMKKRY